MDEHWPGESIFNLSDIWSGNLTKSAGTSAKILKDRFLVYTGKGNKTGLKVH